MIKQIIKRIIKALPELRDDEDIAVYVSESMDMDECPDWMFDLVADIREQTYDDPALLAGEAQFESWVDELCEKYGEEEAA